jgi:hypothetical protein
LIAGARYHVGAPTRLCTDPTGSGGDVLCYRARRAAGKSAKSSVWVAHAFATEALSIGRAREICIPAEAAGRNPEMPPR